MLDALDRAILDVVRFDNRITHEALGARIGLSPSSCRRRLAALRRSGVIMADVAVVDPAKIGLNVTLHALVSLERDAEDAHRAFRDAVARNVAIATCTYVTGPADYLLKIQVASMDQYERLTEWLVKHLPIRRVETMVEIRDVKRT